MASVRSRLRTLSAESRSRVLATLRLNPPAEPYDEQTMLRRRAAIYAFIDPTYDPLEALRMRRHLGWPLEAGSAHRVWALRRQHRALAALRASPPVRLP